MDELDKRLVQLLREDAHASSRILAARLSVSAATVKRRLKRLLQSRTVRIAALPDPYEIGLPVAALIAFKVDRNKIHGVLKALCERPMCKWVWVTSGRFDILTVEWFRSAADLGHFVHDEITKVVGIRDAEPFICLNQVKTFGLADQGKIDTKMSQLDQLDERLIQLVSEDAQVSSKILAGQLSVSAATAKRRLNRLLQSRAVRIVGLPDLGEFGLPVAALIAFKVDRNKIHSVLKALCERPLCIWIRTTLGRFDILTIEWFRSTIDLGDLMRNEVTKIDGVRDAEAFICLRVEKNIGQLA